MQQTAMSVAEAAKVWSVDRRTIYRWIKSGRIRATETTGRKEIPISEVERVAGESRNMAQQNLMRSDLRKVLARDYFIAAAEVYNAAQSYVEQWNKADDAMESDPLGDTHAAAVQSAENAFVDLAAKVDRVRDIVRLMHVAVKHLDDVAPEAQ